MSLEDSSYKNKKKKKIIILNGRVVRLFIRNATITTFLRFYYQEKKKLKVQR